MTVTTSTLTSLLLYFVCGPSSSSVYEPFRARVAVDYGPRLVGVASSDPFGNVLPICTLPNEGDTVYLCSQILDIARTRGALEVIVGLPLDSNGKMSYNVKNFNGQLCLNFSMVLAATTTVALPRASVHLFDERYTTREAKARIKSEKIKASVDAMSAACLLERYLEDQGEGSLPAQPCSYPPPRELMYFNYNIVREHIRETYFSKPMSAEQKRIQIMQNLKEGKRPGMLMQGLGQSYKQKEEKEEAERLEKEEKEEAEKMKRAVFGEVGEKGEKKEVKKDTRPPVRKTLSGRIIGYKGMDPPAAFNSIINEGNEKNTARNGVRSIGNEGGEGGEGGVGGEVEGDGEEEVVLSRVELEMLEYERIKAARRKKGTLKKNYKATPVIPLLDVEDDEEEEVEKEVEKEL